MRSMPVPHSKIMEADPFQQSTGWLIESPPAGGTICQPSLENWPSLARAGARTVEGNIVQAAAHRSLVINESLYPQLFFDKTFLVVHGHSSASLSVQAGAAALWIPVLGRTFLTTNNSFFVATKGDVYASDSQRDLTVEIGQKASCIAVIAHQKVWSEVLDRVQGLCTRPFAVMPAVHRAPQCIRRQLFRFVRETIVRGGGCARNLSLLASSLYELQSGFDPLIQRCPGPSQAAKRTVFLRLQRSLNQVLFSGKQYPKVSEMAHLSNYSIDQFIRVFSKVYGKTPYAHMASVLAARAKELLTSSDLAIGDVAAAVGIQSPATFKRIMKKNLGQSATLIRRQARSQ